MRNAIVEVQQRYPSSGLGVGTGWSSPKILHERDEFAPLTAWAWEQARPHDAVHLDAWANLYRVGDEVRAHDHHQAQLTAVYCLYGEGELLVDGYGSVWMTPGLLVILDGRQVHSVPPSRARRISIAMNLYG